MQSNSDPSIPTVDQFQLAPLTAEERLKLLVDHCARRVRPRRRCPPVALVARGALFTPAGLRAQELTEATYAKRRDHVLPKPSELAYRRIAWRPSYWEAVVEAHALEARFPMLRGTIRDHNTQKRSNAHLSNICRSQEPTGKKHSGHLRY